MGLEYIALICIAFNKANPAGFQYPAFASSAIATKALPIDIGLTPMPFFRNAPASPPSSEAPYTLKQSANERTTEKRNKGFDV
jgi:hypothetical protein